MSTLWVVTKGDAPWGDYGSILTHGISAHRPRVGGRIQLERTGPFIPHLSLPGIGDVVITALMRANIERSGMSGAVFREVDNVHIAHLDWRIWNLSAEE